MAEPPDHLGGFASGDGHFRHPMIEVGSGRHPGDHSMIQLKSAALGLALLAFAGGSAVAMPDGDMHKMSAKHMKKMRSCKAMDHDMMMKNRGCMKMMKMHPDMMKDDGMMKKDDMMKK